MKVSKKEQARLHNEQYAKKQAEDVRKSKFPYPQIKSVKEVLVKLIAKF